MGGLDSNLHHPCADEDLHLSFPTANRRRQTIQMVPLWHERVLDPLHIRLRLPLHRRLPAIKGPLECQDEGDLPE